MHMATSKYESAVQDACQVLRTIFSTEDGDDIINKKLNVAWVTVSDTIEKAGDSKLKKSVRNRPEFSSYVAPGSNEEQQLINLLKRMAKKEVPWEELFENGKLLMSR